MCVCVCVCVRAAVFSAWARCQVQCTFIATCLNALRDGEDAYVSVNGKTCWTKTNILGTVGTQQCGGVFKEERFRVSGCFVTLPAVVTLSGARLETPLTVRVWTSLDGDPTDESFGIDNVVIIVENFEKADPMTTPCQSKADGEFLPERK